MENNIKRRVLVNMTGGKKNDPYFKRKVYQILKSYKARS
jgi:hypothetical protein